jgi:pimeloyl-ACP methyl ester carboxylesterase
VLTPLLAMLPVVVLMAAGAYYYTPDLPAALLEERYAQASSRFATVQGLRIHYADEGRGPPLLLLHGLTSNLFAYDGWAALLRDDFRVVRLDLPGHGLTGPDPLQRYRPEEVADLVVAFMDELGIARAHLAGSSLGGAIAWQTAVRHPERVDRLVLLAPVGYPIEGELPLALRLLGSPTLGPVLARLAPFREFERRLALAYGDPARLDHATARREFDLFRREGNRDALAAMLGGGTDMADPLSQLARITAPTLVLWGTRDAILPPFVAPNFAGAIPGARLAWIAGAGHAPMMELPEASIEPVRAFLEGR